MVFSFLLAVAHTMDSNLACVAPERRCGGKALVKFVTTLALTSLACYANQGYHSMGTFHLWPKDLFPLRGYGILEMVPRPSAPPPLVPSIAGMCHMAPQGLEPRTSRFCADRPNHLSYRSCERHSTTNARQSAPNAMRNSARNGPS